MRVGRLGFGRNQKQVLHRERSSGSPFRTFLLVLMGLPALAQAPLLQDGAAALRQARLDWAQGQSPLPPLSLPSLEVGFGGAGSDGVYAPLIDGEGLGHGTQGLGLGLQGRYVQGGWSLSTTMLALRNQGRTEGILQRAALAYQTESGWRAALELAPLAWGSGLAGGGLLGDAARPFSRLSLSTPEASLLGSRWHAEAFAGRLEPHPLIPAWISNRTERLAARDAGLELQRPQLRGGLVRAWFGTLVEASLGCVSMGGGQDGLGHAAPVSSARSEALAELKIRLPFLARLLQGRGASLFVNRIGTPDGNATALTPARDLGGLQLVWEGWDLALEFAGAAPRTARTTFLQPAYLSGFSTHGDPLGSAFGLESVTRTAALGIPLFLEGQGRLLVVRATSVQDSPTGSGSWLLQAEAQWRTSTGRIGASLVSQRQEFPAASVCWGWAGSVFQTFRVF